MDPIEPILPKLPTPLPVHAAQRNRPVHRDGRDGRGGGQGESRRRRDEEPAVEVDVEGVEELDGTDTPMGVPGPASVHRIDITADGEIAPPAHRIDLSA